MGADAWSRRTILGMSVAALIRRPVAAFAQSPQPDFNKLPRDLPVPKDDGAAGHLTGMALPDISLRSTRNRLVNLSTLTSPRVVIYAYPRTGAPGVPVPAGWDDIPGARGCTPETCGFRDHHKDLARLHADVYGLSTQDTPYQQEMVKRLEVPFEVLSDDHLLLTRALRLPTFTFDGATLLKRLTLVARGGRIEHVFYPVFPPDTHAQEVIEWLRAHPVASNEAPA
jgi:peroxiredoxin